MSGVALNVTWNYQLVALSYALSVFGSWTTLLQIEQACLVGTWEQALLIVGASLSMGVSAIWSMHFTGMLALEVGSSVLFDPLWTALSALVAVIFCGIGIHKTVALTHARRRLKSTITAAGALKQLGAAGAWTGLGVATMHYMGMYSMRMGGEVQMHFDPIMVGMSILIALCAATAAFCVFHYAHSAWEQIVAAFVMGFAVCGMHYTGMAACSYTRIANPPAPVVEPSAGLDSHLVASLIVILNGCFFFFVLAGLTLRLRNSKRELERLVKERTAQLTEEQARSDALLFSVLPKHVAEVLKSGGLPPNLSFDDASILFMDIVGFTALCARSSPQQIVDLLNRVFGLCDVLILRHGLTKIDMIGDCLIAAAGVPVSMDNHAIRLADFALDAIGALSSIDMKDQEADRVEVRVGICSGPLAAGVVGLDMPHYSVFGDTVNMAARMEQSSERGRVHYTGLPSHVDALKRHFSLVLRERLVVKGKEQSFLETYWINGRLPDHHPTVLGPVELLARENCSLVGLRRKGSFSAPDEGVISGITKDVQIVLQKGVSRNIDTIV